MKEMKLCNDCGKLTYIYHKKKQLCQYCWKKERSVVWKENSKPKKAYPIKARSKKGVSVANEDSKFFHKLWKENPHICENCNKNLSIDLEDIPIRQYNLKVRKDYTGHYRGMEEWYENQK